jgi:predicted transcriptional regulator
MSDMTKLANANPSSPIQRRREALGVSRELLAANAGLSVRTIERIEAGVVEPHRATLAVIEAVLSAAETEAAA